MTDVEEKSLKAQIELYKGIQETDNMIIYTVQMTANKILNDIIKPKMYTKTGQTTVELTVDEFTEIRVAFAKLANDDGFEELTPWLTEKYLNPKKEKQKILGMLQ